MTRLLPDPHIQAVLLDSPILRASYNAAGQSVLPDDRSQPIAREDCLVLSECRRARPYLTPDAAVMFTVLAEECAAEGWDLRWTELYRPVEVQGRARLRYEAKGGPFTARPYESAHPAFRAGDLFVTPLSRSGVDYLTFRDRAERRGFTTVVPRLYKGKPRRWGHSETWHWQYDGHWGPVRARLGYAQAMFGAILDVGGWDWLLEDARTNPASSWRGWDEARVCYAVVQAQLQRGGYDCGRIDGLPGGRTAAAAAALGLDLAGDPVDVAEASYRVPSATRVLWGPSLMEAA